MPSAPEPTPQKSPWNWPAEWAVERAFWREVGTRTIAGILTILILGVPGLIYLLGFGLLTFGQVAPILIGLGLSTLVLVSYVLVLRRIRRKERLELLRALLDEQPISGSPVSPEDVLAFSTQQMREVLSRYPTRSQADVTNAAKASLRKQIITTVVGLPIFSVLVTSVAAYLAYLWFR